MSKELYFHGKTRGRGMREFGEGYCQISGTNSRLEDLIFVVKHFELPCVEKCCININKHALP